MASKKSVREWAAAALKRNFEARYVTGAAFSLAGHTGAVQ